MYPVVKIATWYACRQNVEFYKNSDFGCCCAAFTSQPIEMDIWAVKRQHWLHGNGNWNQIPKLMNMTVAALEGSIKHDLPDYVAISQQHKRDNEKWWIDGETERMNDAILNNFSGLFKYFVSIIKQVRPMYDLSERIVSILNDNKDLMINEQLKKYLHKLGLKHCNWRSNNLVRNQHVEADMNDDDLSTDISDVIDYEDDESELSDTNDWFDEPPLPATDHVNPMSSPAIGSDNDNSSAHSDWRDAFPPSNDSNDNGSEVSDTDSDKFNPANIVRNEETSAIELLTTVSLKQRMELLKIRHQNNH